MSSSQRTWQWRWKRWCWKTLIQTERRSTWVGRGSLCCLIVLVASSLKKWGMWLWRWRSTHSTQSHCWCAYHVGHLGSARWGERRWLPAVRHLLQYHSLGASAMTTQNILYRQLVWTRMALWTGMSFLSTSNGREFSIQIAKIQTNFCSLLFAKVLFQQCVMRSSNPNLDLWSHQFEMYSLAITSCSVKRVSFQLVTMSSFCNLHGMLN